MAKAPERKKLPQLTSPIATFRYPKLNEPDKGNDKFPKPDGEYSVQFILKASDKDTQKFIKQLQPLYEEALEAANVGFKELKAEARKKLGSVKPNPFYTEILDQETEEPTGDIVFKATMKASGVRKKGPKAGQKWTRQPIIFDSHGVRMVKLPQIWSGTTGFVAFEVSQYFVPGTAAAGIKLNLVGVQIVDLQSGGERSASSLGFGAVDGGYSHDDSAIENGSNGDASDDGSADEGDF